MPKRHLASVHIPLLNCAMMLRGSRDASSVLVMEQAMKSTLKLAVLLGLASGLMTVAAQAADWTAREAELVGLHQLCDKGDRKACIRFGMMLGEAKERHADWRAHHPEFWWWEH